MNAYLSLTAAPSRSTLAFFRNAFSISRSRLRRSSSRSRARSDNSSGGSSAACAARYFFTQPPTVDSLSPYSRDTSAIDRVVSITSLATSSRQSGLYFSYFPAISSIPFRSGHYSVRSPETGRHANTTGPGCAPPAHARAGSTTRVTAPPTAVCAATAHRPGLLRTKKFVNCADCRGVRASWMVSAMRPGCGGGVAAGGGGGGGEAELDGGAATGGDLV